MSATPATKFVDQRHAEYRANEADWTLYQSAYKGGREFAQTAILKHVRELDGEFEGRKKRTYPVGLCSEVVKARLAYLSKKPAVVTGIEALSKDFMSDVDMCGNDFQAFTNRVAAVAEIYGTAWVGADMPRIETEPGKPRTALDDQTQGVRPFLVSYKPTEVVNWSTDRFGKLEWALVRAEHKSAALSIGVGGVTVATEPSPPYLLWTRTDWVRLDKEGAIVDTAPHGLGVVPLALVRFERSATGEFLGLSLLREIADKVKNIINTLSLVSESHYSQTYSILVMDADSMSALLSSSGSGVVQSGGAKPDVNVVVGPKRILPYRDNPPSFISPDSSQVKTLMEYVSWAMADVLNDAALIGGFSPDASGLSKQWDFNRTNQALRAQAANLADGLEYALWFACAWAGSPDAEPKVTYPTEFGVESGSDVLQRFAQLVLAPLQLPPMLLAAYLKKIARQEFDETSGVDLKAIEKEIDSEQFVESGPPENIYSRM